MEKKLGEGGMGAVYLAEDLTLSRRVAIKFMSRALLVQQGNEKLRDGLEKRFIREAKSAAAINHPNLAQIYEANFDSDNWYIAMEFIDGKSLFDHLEDGKKYRADEIINVCRQTASGLDFAWDNYKIVHRDIKPHNIMLSKSNLIKIVDLGLAKPLESDLVEEMPDLTGAGTPIGTPQYMAPEQATGQKDITFKVDIFALGATLYELCTGKKAFSGNTAPMIYMCQVQKKYAPLKEFRSDLPENLIKLIDTMLEPKPENRIGSYAEILTALNEPMDSVSDPEALQSTQIYQVGSVSPTIAGQMSGKTIGVDHTIFRPADQLIKDRYRILKPIGKSKAGMVYHCMDTQLSVECVVKSIFPGREFPEHEMPRVKANYQRLMGLSHPNLVQIRDLQQDEDTGELFVLMELLPGQNLREYIHKVKNQYHDVDIKTVLPTLQIVAKALDSVGKAFNVIHHDLTPEEIYLLDNDTKVKLLDYGITYPSADDQQQIPPADLHKFPLATPDYMSPEIWERKAFSRQSDQYSFAVIIYELLSDKLPFWLKDPIKESQIGDDSSGTDGAGLHEQQLKNLFRRVIEEPPKPLIFLKKHENAAIAKALAKDPHARFLNCEAFIDDLSRSGGMASGLKIALAGAAALALIGGIGFSFLQKGKEQTPAATSAMATKKRPPSAARPKEGLPAAVSAAESLASKSESRTTVRAGPVTKESTDDTQTESKEPLTIAIKPVLSEEDQQLERDLERRRLEEKAAAEALKASYQQLRAELALDPVSAELLPQADQLLKTADRSFAQSKFQTAVIQYQEATAAVNNIVAQTKDLKLQRLLELKDEAGNLKKTFEEQRSALAKNEKAARALPELDEVAKEADIAFANEAFAAAIRQYKKAIDSTHDISNRFKKEMRKEAEELIEIVQNQRKELAKYRELSPDIAEKIVKVDVAISLGRDAFNKEEFIFALEQYNNALTESKSILILAENKFQAKVGKDFTNPKVGMEFVWIEGMKLWVGRFEVTNGEFRKFKQTHDSKKSMGFTLNRDSQPALEVSYYDAVGYCQWLNAISLKDIKAPEGYTFRLPSRDEWVAIGRCGTERLYPWGNDWPPKYGNFGNQEVFPGSWQLDGYSDEFPVTCNVDQSGENDWGLYGVAGNVWEWTTELNNGKRAVMGGDWTSVGRETMIVSVEGAYAPMDEPFDNIGFRIFLALEK